MEQVGRAVSVLSLQPFIHWLSALTVALKKILLVIVPHFRCENISSDTEISLRRKENGETGRLASLLGVCAGDMAAYIDCSHKIVVTQHPGPL